MFKNSYKFLLKRNISVNNWCEEIFSSPNSAKSVGEIVRDVCTEMEIYAKTGIVCNGSLINWNDKNGKTRARK